MKKILNKLPIISICLVFCLTLLLGVFLTLPQSKDVYATTINWTQKAPGLYDDYGNFVIMGEDDGGDILSSWSRLKEIYSISSGSFYCDASGNLVIGDNCCNINNASKFKFICSVKCATRRFASAITNTRHGNSNQLNTWLCNKWSVSRHCCNICNNKQKEKI
ncbi:MAG: hypothetical protein J6T74_05530 [Clostridia bacterium]|nr:hypothetical protein [Clostridia bacterium]